MVCTFSGGKVISSKSSSKEEGAHGADWCYVPYRNLATGGAFYHTKIKEPQSLCLKDKCYLNDFSSDVRETGQRLSLPLLQRFKNLPPEINLEITHDIYDWTKQSTSYDRQAQRLRVYDSVRLKP